MALEVRPLNGEFAAEIAGDAVLWDNRCTLHCATPFDETRYVRLMHRTTLEGDAPIMA